MTINITSVFTLCSPLLLATMPAQSSQILEINLGNQLRIQKLTELFFEGNEPPFDVLYKNVGPRHKPCFCSWINLIQ